MIIRTSDKMKFDLLNNSVQNVQNKYSEIMEKLASQKQVNRPSDDPLGMSNILSYRAARAHISTYERNIEGVKSWINITESKLTEVSNILVQVREMAISQSTATANPTTRNIAATALEPLIDQIVALANSKFDDRYIFSGSRTEVEPFSKLPSDARIGKAVSANENSFNGSVASGGAYTGDRNKTYVLKIVASGAPGQAEYKVSEDGGKTWGTSVSVIPPSGVVNVGSEGVNLTFTSALPPPGDFSENDIFYVNAYAPGYYGGNSEELSMDVGQNIKFNYGISGETAFTDRGGGKVDILKVLNDFKTALHNNDTKGIRDKIGLLEEASDQITKYTAKCGTRLNSLDIAVNTLKDMDTRLAGFTSEVEDADMSQLIIFFNMKEAALKASYSMAGSIGNISIINFLK